MNDQTAVGRALMAPGIVLASGLLIFWLVKVAGISGFYAVPILIVGLALWLHPAAIIALLPAAFASSLVLPGLPAMMTLSQALSGLLGGWGVIHRATVKRGRPQWTASDWGMLGFLGVCVFLMLTRGFGMRVFGGTMYGGFGYVIVLASGLGFLASPFVRLNRRQIRWMAILLVVAALLPLLMEVSVTVTGGRTVALYRFFSIGMEYALGGVASGQAAGLRFSAGRAVGLAIIMTGLVMRPRGGFAHVVRIVLIGAGMLGVLLSGFRSVLLLALLALALWHWTMTRHRVLSAAIVVAIFLLVWGVAIVGGRSLPSPVQRSVSFLPGVEVEAVVRSSAQASLDWRFQIWRIALPNVPKYLWIGRGLVTDVSPVAWMRREFYVTPEFFYEMKGYHSGPLSLLLDFGLPGFVFGSMFMIGLCSEGWRLRRRLRPDLDDMVARMHLFWLCLTTATVVLFYLVVGDVRASFPEIVVYGIALRACGACMEAQAAERGAGTPAVVPAPNGANLVGAGAVPARRFSG